MCNYVAQIGIFSICCMVIKRVASKYSMLPWLIATICDYSRSFAMRAAESAKIKVQISKFENLNKNQSFEPLAISHGAPYHSRTRIC